MKEKGIEKNLKSKPKINLISIDNIVINTRTQKEYQTIMKIYECAGWTFAKGKSTTSKNLWVDENCYITAGTFDYDGEGEKIMVSDCKHTLKGKWKIISPNEFYQIQQISKKMIEEVEEYFKEKNISRI